MLNTVNTIPIHRKQTRNILQSLGMAHQCTAGNLPTCGRLQPKLSPFFPTLFAANKLTLVAIHQGPSLASPQSLYAKWLTMQ